MKVDYSIGAPVFAGIYRNINADWRRFAYLRAWIKPDGSRRNLAVMLKESSGKIWHFNYPLSGTKSEVLTIPFQDFRLYLGSGEMDLKEINQLILYLTKGTGENGSGSIYLDNFEVLISPATSLDFSLTPMMPEKFALFQNYPNPFNRVTAISYQLLTSSEIELSLFDLLGRKIKTLVQQKQNAGDYSIDCDASELASGIYLYQIRAGDFVQAKKMILIR